MGWAEASRRAGGPIEPRAAALADRRLRRCAADDALGGAVEQIVFGAAPARDDAVRTTAVGDPQHVRALGDVVERWKRIEIGCDVPARVRSSALAGIWHTTLPGDWTSVARVRDADVSKARPVRKIQATNRRWCPRLLRARRGEQGVREGVRRVRHLPDGFARGAGPATIDRSTGWIASVYRAARTRCTRPNSSRH